jgi:hypothetical protein
MKFLNDFGFEVFRGFCVIFSGKCGFLIFRFKVFERNVEGWSDKLTSTPTLKSIVLSSKENLLNSMKYLNQKRFPKILKNANPKIHSQIPESSVPKIALFQQICLLMSISQTRFVEKFKKSRKKLVQIKIENGWKI